MTTKKGYIGNSNGQWVIAEKATIRDWAGTINWKYVKNAVPLHPDSLPAILSNGSLRPAYQGEVDYEEERAYEVIIKNGTATKGENYTTYAIPKPVESKVDVWGQAMSTAKDYADQVYKPFEKLKGDHQLFAWHIRFAAYLKQYYQLTKK